MKKRVEAELISIAHRILKLKNKSEVDQLYKETQKLYEALTILKFYGDNYEMVKETISEDDIENKLQAILDTEAAVKSSTPNETAPKNVQEEVVEEVVEVETKLENEAEIPEIDEEIKSEEETVIVGEIQIEEDEIEDESFEDNETEEKNEVEDLVGESIEEVGFMPSFELSFEDEKITSEEKVDANVPSKQITMDDILGDHYKEPVFVKPDEVANEKAEKFVSVFQDKKEVESGKVVSLNDALSNTISIGLNDRIGFVKHLFNDSNEDYNRVLSQLNTFDTFQEAKDFLNEMVIPDYNYWVGKEEYLERFMEIIEKKFK